MCGEQHEMSRTRSLFGASNQIHIESSDKTILVEKTCNHFDLRVNVDNTVFDPQPGGPQPITLIYDPNVFALDSNTGLQLRTQYPIGRDTNGVKLLYDPNSLEVDPASHALRCKLWVPGTGNLRGNPLQTDGPGLWLRYDPATLMMNVDGIGVRVAPVALTTLGTATVQQGLNVLAYKASVDYADDALLTNKPDLTLWARWTQLGDLATKSRVDWNLDVNNRPDLSVYELKGSLRALAYKDKVDYATDVINVPAGQDMSAYLTKTAANSTYISVTNVGDGLAYQNNMLQVSNLDYNTLVNLPNLAVYQTTAATAANYQPLHGVLTALSQTSPTLVSCTVNDLTPQGNAMYNLGTAGLTFLNVYTQNIQAGNLRALAFKVQADYGTDLINKPTLGSLAAKNAVDYATADVVNKPTLGALASKTAVDYNTSDVINKPTLGALAAKGAVDYATADVVNKPDLSVYLTSATAASTYQPTIAAGTGLTKTGNSLSVNAAQSQITSLGTLTGLTVGGSIVTNGAGGQLQMIGSTSGSVTHKVPASFTSYTLTWPSAIASVVGSALVTSTTGTMSWADLSVYQRTLTVSAPLALASNVLSLGSIDYAGTTIINKPTLGALAAKAAVDYNTTDILNKPTLGALAAKAAVDYNTTDIINKPTLGALAAKSAVDYSSTDIINKPTLPTPASSGLGINVDGSNKINLTATSRSWPSTAYTNQTLPLVQMTADNNPQTYSYAAPASGAPANPITFTCFCNTQTGGQGGVTNPNSAYMAFNDTSTWGWVGGAYNSATGLPVAPVTTTNLGSGDFLVLTMSVPATAASITLTNYNGANAASNLSFKVGGCATAVTSPSAAISTTWTSLATGTTSGTIPCLVSLSNMSCTSYLVQITQVSNSANQFKVDTITFNGASYTLAPPSSTVPLVTQPVLQTAQIAGTVYSDSSNAINLAPATGTALKLWVGGTSIGDDTSSGESAFELGSGRKADGVAYMDLHASASSDYDARVLRYAGYNGDFTVTNNGTGNVNLVSGTHMYVGTGGNCVFGPQTDNRTYLGMSGNRWITVYSINGVTSTSDENQKQDMQPLTAGLDFVKKLRPITYRFKTGDGKTRMGLGARQTKQTMDALDMTNYGLVEDTGDLWGMNYSELVAPLINAVQELSQQVADLQTRLTAVEAKVANKK